MDLSNDLRQLWRNHLNGQKHYQSPSKLTKRKDTENKWTGEDVGPTYVHRKVRINGNEAKKPKLGRNMGK